VDAERAAEQPDALADSEETEPVRASPRVEADAVIADADVDQLVALVDIDANPVGMSVLLGVREGFLHDPVDGGVELEAVGGAVGEVDAEGDVDAVARGALGER